MHNCKSFWLDYLAELDEELMRQGRELADDPTNTTGQPPRGWGLGYDPIHAYFNLLTLLGALNQARGQRSTSPNGPNGEPFDAGPTAGLAAALNAALQMDLMDVETQEPHNLVAFRWLDTMAANANNPAKGTLRGVHKRIRWILDVARTDAKGNPIPEEGDDDFFVDFLFGQGGGDCDCEKKCCCCRCCRRRRRHRHRWLKHKAHWNKKQHEICRERNRKKGRTLKSR